MPKLMPISQNDNYCSFTLGSVHEKFDVSHGPKSLNVRVHILSLLHPLILKRFLNSQVLTGNSNWRDVMKNSIPVIYARYIRLVPLTWHIWPCTRMEIYGEPWLEGENKCEF